MCAGWGRPTLAVEGYQSKWTKNDQHQSIPIEYVMNSQTENNVIVMHFYSTRQNKTHAQYYESS